MGTLKQQHDEYTPDESARRAEIAIRRAFQMPYKPHRDLVGTTPRAKARRKAKTAQESK